MQGKHMRDDVDDDDESERKDNQREWEREEEGEREDDVGKVAANSDGVAANRVKWSKAG